MPVHLGDPFHLPLFGPARKKAGGRSQGRSRDRTIPSNALWTQVGPPLPEPVCVTASSSNREATARHTKMRGLLGIVYLPLAPRCIVRAIGCER
jgi:hypothetical protein